VKKCLACSHHYDSDVWVCPKCKVAPDTAGGFLVFSPEQAFNNEGFSADYFENLARLEEGSFWFRARNRLILWALEKYFPNIRNYFEIGCGTGFVTSGIHKAFPELQISASEVFLAGLPYVKQRLPEIPIYQMDARTVPFYKEFDVIGAFDVLEHIEEDQTVLKQIFEAVKPGGGIMLTVPQHRWLWSEIDDFSFHKRRYSRREIVQKIESAGFHIIKATSFVSLLLPVMVLARMRYLLPTRKVDRNLEFKLGEGVNRLLEVVMAIEMVLIRAGINLPLGGSLFVVASKEWKE